MRSIRRVGGLAVAGLLLTAAASGPAGAATPASYSGSASGYALKLSIGEDGLTAGSSTAKASSAGTGAAEGAGGVTPLATFGQVTATNPPGETKAESCDQVLPPAPLNALPLSLGLGCGTAAATGSGAESVASANGKVGQLGVDANIVLSQLDPALAPATDALKTILNAICAGIPNPVNPIACGVTDEVQAITESIQAAQTLNADVGSSTSSVSVAGTSVTSESTGTAAVLRLLPNATLQGIPLGEPLVTVTISRANAKVICDLTSGNATPSFDPAIVRIKFSNPLAAILPNLDTSQLPTVAIPDALGQVGVGTPIDPTIALNGGELTVTPGSVVVLFPGLPIETEIRVGGGTSTVNADRSATANADGVKINALRGTGSPLAGGILLNLAHAEATGACVAAVGDDAPAPPTLDVPRELPRTGGTPWLPLAGVVGLAVAVVTRRTLGRSH